MASKMIQNNYTQYYHHMLMHTTISVAILQLHPGRQLPSLPMLITIICAEQTLQEGTARSTVCQWCGYAAVHHQ